MRNKLTGYYSIFLGVAILGMWFFILFTEPIGEGKTEMTFHLFSEFLMAFILLISGIMLTRNNKNALRLNIAGHAMLIYSVLNAAGYYAEREEWIIPMVFIFLLLISAMIISYQVFKDFDLK
jgi:CHASE2 domain-containing sensor protein